MMKSRSSACWHPHAPASPGPRSCGCRTGRAINRSLRRWELGCGHPAPTRHAVSGRDWDPPPPRILRLTPVSRGQVACVRSIRIVAISNFQRTFGSMAAGLRPAVSGRQPCCQSPVRDRSAARGRVRRGGRTGSGRAGCLSAFCARIG